MTPFQSEDKVLVNGKHAEVKTLKDIGGGHFEVGVVYTEDKRFDTVIYPFTDIQKIDSPIESAKKLKFDPSWKYDLATDALRFKHAYLYDPLFSLSTTRIDALPHQIEAVYDKILPAHEQRFLLADDPGLGKTIMAGMVFKELHARGRANRVLIVTPAPLSRQWIRELHEMFELEFTNYDCCDNVLLLTATPHDGNPYPFFSLLQLIDPYIAQDEYSLIPERTDQIIIRRLKEDAKKWDGTPLFKKRYVESIPLEYDEKGPEYKFYEQITNYVTHHYNKSKGDEKKRAVGFAMVILQKRMVSSLFSITKSLEKRAIRLREALRKREQALEALKELNEYEQEYEDLEDERREEIEDHLLALTTAEHPKEMEIEIRQLEGLVEDAKKIPKDTKAEKFLEFVKSIFDKKPDEKLLVFTEYKDTLTYLAGGISEGKKITGILENAGYKLTQIRAKK